MASTTSEEHEELTDEELGQGVLRPVDAEYLSVREGVAAIFCKKPALLLVFVPVAWVNHLFLSTPPVVTFVLNFLAIIPLAWCISEATESLEVPLGPTWGALLNATFGNVVEILLSVSAVKAGLVKIVQATLLGSILMNLLFVLGCCFLVAGCRTHNLEFNAHSLTYNLAMLAIGSLGLIVPTFSAALDQWSTPDERLTLSRFVSCFLMAMYVQWLVFALSTHTSLVASTPQLIPSDEVPEKTVPPVLATVVVAASTVLVAMHCEFLVHAIEPVMEELQLKEAFMSTVILPLVGNISEEIAAISIASKGKIDLAMAVAIGAATQVALFAVPVVVFIAWGIGQPMDLDFEVEQVILLIFSLVVVFMSLQDAEGNWLKGTMLITAYVIVCCSFWTMHNREFESAGAAAIGAVVQTTKQSVQT